MREWNRYVVREAGPLYMGGGEHIFLAAGEKTCVRMQCSAVVPYQDRLVGG